MNEYLRYYHEDRTHLTLEKSTPAHRHGAKNSDAGSYPGQDLAGCITATIWPPESALPAFLMNLQGQQLTVPARLSRSTGSSFSDFPVINRLLPLKNRSQTCLRIREPGPFPPWMLFWRNTGNFCLLLRTHGQSPNRRSYRSDLAVMELKHVLTTREISQIPLLLDPPGAMHGSCGRIGSELERSWDRSGKLVAAP
jgi:hypothetical protein